MALGVLLIWLSVKDLTSNERTEIINSFKNANYFWILLAICCGVLSHILRSIRWRRLLSPMGYHPKIKNMFLATMIGYFANYAIPRLGEVSRCGVLNRTDKIPINKGLGTVVTERAFDLLIFIIIFIVTVFIEKDRIGSYLDTNIYPKLNDKFAFLSSGGLLYIIVGFGLVVFILYFVLRKRLRKNKFFQKLEEIGEGFLHGIRSLFKMKKPWLFLLETVGIWGLYFLMTYLCFFSMEDTSSLGIDAGLATLVIGSLGIMVTPGGIGLFPILVQETLKLYTVAKISGLAMGWIIWTSQTVMIIVLGAIALFVVSFNKKITQVNVKT
jgi:glycosyltransferase 2 family protein